MTYVVPPGARLEVKFEADESRLHDMLHWLRLHRSRFSEVYPPRRVDSIYFDSPDYRAMADNFAGISARTKVRIRWYGVEREPSPGALELKRKRNGFGWKLRYDLTVPRRRHATNWKKFREAVDGQLPREARHWLAGHAVPTLMNSYLRRYYLSGDGKVRVTVDTEQMVWDQRIKPYMNLKYRANLPRRMILEFKFERRDRRTASEIVQGLPIRLSRHSKYLTGGQAGWL
jgi:hypothetical protein